MPYTFRQIVDKRDTPYAWVNEPHQISVSSPYYVLLNEKPDGVYPVFNGTASVYSADLVTRYTEVTGSPVNPKEFVVNYETGIITFTSADAGAPVVVTYSGLGSVVMASDVVSAYNAINSLDSLKLNIAGGTITGSLTVDGNILMGLTSTVDGIILHTHTHTTGTSGPQIPTAGLVDQAVTWEKINNTNNALRIQEANLSQSPAAVTNLVLRSDPASLAKVSADLLRANSTLSQLSVKTAPVASIPTDIMFDGTNGNKITLGGSDATHHFSFGLYDDTLGTSPNQLVFVIPPYADSKFVFKASTYNGTQILKVAANATELYSGNMTINQSLQVDDSITATNNITATNGNITATNGDIAITTGDLLMTGDIGTTTNKVANAFITNLGDATHQVTNAYITNLYLGDLKMKNGWTLDDSTDELIWISPKGKKYKMLMVEE